MSLKKYTLYYKGKNKYGHEHIFKLISLDVSNSSQAEKIIEVKGF